MYYTKAANVNSKRRDAATNGMIPNRFVFMLVFVSGLAAAFVVALLAQYLCGVPTEYEGKQKLINICFYDHVCHNIKILFIAIFANCDKNMRVDSLFQFFFSENEFRNKFASLPLESFLNVYDSRLTFPSDNTELDKVRVQSTVASTTEALTSLHLAMEMKVSGKQKKAIKLFQHAVALAPRHPDILNHYGEFLEHTQNNIIKANEFYVRALTYKPNHEGALINSQRTARVVEELDRLMLKRIDEKRNTLSNIPDDNVALIRAKTEAYFQHIYHTVGIEGNTMNLAQTRAIVETRLAVDGKSIDEHNEIIGLDAAMKYIIATMGNK